MHRVIAAIQGVAYAWLAMEKTDQDTELVRLAQSGDARAFEALVVKYQRRIARHVARYMRRAVDVEDIVHLLNEMGVETGIDTAEAARAAWDVSRLLGIEPASHVTRSGTREEVLERGRTNPRQHPH